MKLITLLKVTSEYRKVELRDNDGKVISTYETKDSIDIKYCNKLVLLVSCENNTMVIYINLR